MQGSHPLSEIEFVAFDLETTGLFPIACRIVEFGAVRFRLDGCVLGEFSQLVDPRCEIPPEAEAVHGIRREMVRGMPTVEEVLPRFLAFLEEPSTVLMAHNASFDLGFLGMAMGKAGVRPPGHAVLDGVDLARHCLRGMPSYRLEQLGTSLGLADYEEHRALPDARLLMAVFCRLVNESPRLRTLGQLLQVCPPLGFESSAVDAPVGYEGLAGAIEQRVSIQVLYEGGSCGAVWRKVTPQTFLCSGGRFYLVAYCHRSRVEKTFRLDRIRKYRLESDLPGESFGEPP